MRKNAWVLVIVVGTGCVPNPMGDVRLQLRGEALLTDVSYREVDIGRSSVCRIGPSRPIILQTLEPAPRCASVDEEFDDHFFILVPDGVFEIQRLPTGAGNGDACATECSRVTLFDLNLGNPRQILSPGPYGAFAVERPWVVWSDLRFDTNGLCFFPATDEDCRVDLFGYNLETNEEVRLTAHGTVHPPISDFGRRILTTDGRRVVYVDRRDAPADCFGEGLSPFGRPDCTTQLRVLDLRTGEDRVLVGSYEHATRPILADTHIVWFGGPSDGRLTLNIQPIDSSTDAAAVTVIDTPDLEADPDYDDGLVVYQADMTARAYSIPDGNIRTLNDSRETGRVPSIDGGRAVWLADDEFVIMLDLSTGRRRVLRD